MSKTFQAFEGPLAVLPVSTPRRVLALALRSASLGLARLARRVRVAQAGRSLQRLPELEFYAEAGAPEGALYIDGELVGMLPGVSRL
jgi:hypothetical protein